MTSADIQDSFNQESLLRHITDRIRRSLELQDILTSTVAEVRSFLGTDRIMIYKFHPDESGQVVAESIHENLPSLLGLNFPADDIPPHARQLFLESRVRSVVDVESQQIGQSLMHDPYTGDALLGEFEYRPLDPCHAEYLTAMGVKSSLVTPIIYQNQLWGLLVSHHAESKIISESQICGIQLVVDQLAVAIAQSTLLIQAREQADREAMINHITVLLHSLPTIELQAALEEIVTTLQGSGGRLAIFTRSDQVSYGNSATDDLIKVYTCGKQPMMPEQAKFSFMEQYNVWQSYFQSVGQAQSWAISDLYDVSDLRNLQPAFRPTSIRSLLMIPLQARQRMVGYLSIFRDEIATETLWAGQFDPDARQLYPRQSFDVWRHSQHGQVQQWTESDLELAVALSSQVASAIEQYELYQQVWALNANLENQVRERTTELQQMTEQQRILFKVVTKIRESLDLNTVFNTTVQEVRQSLNADRVAIHRFTPASDLESSSIVAEDVLPQFISILGRTIQDHWFKQKYTDLYRQGRVFAVDDIHTIGLEDCHVQLLNQFQVKGNLVVPLTNGEDLWGLLCVHHCAQAHHWEFSEIQFVSQVSAQLSVAVEQADLLAQTQEQANQLAQMLQNLQKAQTQLVQTEKMSSLGQLVAGVAHEINNPVNFIYGNIAHVSEYAEDLLSLMRLYQKHYPTPDTEIQERAETIDFDFLASDLPKTLSSMKLGADRIRQIVLSLRNFSRLDQAEMKSVDIHEGIDSTLLILHHRLKTKSDSSGIELVKKYGNLPLVECYAGQLNQVFMNLLSNAIDALEEWNAKRSLSEIQTNPATIQIRTDMIDRDRVAIHISDNGMGIPKHAQKHLFDPFFTTKPVGKGTGLGLSISYEIVADKHKGDLKCMSLPGQGAEFIIEIPIRQSIFRK